MESAQATELIQDYYSDMVVDNLARSDSNGALSREGDREFAELRRLVTEKGLLNKQPVYYISKILLTLGLLGASLTVLLLVNTLWLQLLNAAFLAFVFTQIGFIGHDAGHRQIFRKSNKSDVIALPIALLLGFSRSWWIVKHNRHHGTPNQVDEDPDIAIPVLAFSQQQAISKRGFYRFIVRYQAYFFFPILSLQGLGLHLASILFLRNEKAKYPRVEMLLIAVHFVAYFGLLFSFLQIWEALVFILIHQLLFGLYNGSAFAPNHKGMPIVEKESRMDFLRQQIVTARNVKGHPLTDFWYGGLNYQIEHHLFPNMSRNKLREAQKIVKPFCQAHSIPYHETSMVQSFREILQFLHEVSAPLRQPKTPVLPAAEGQQT